MWHRLAIRHAVGDYRIGVIFVPIYRDIMEEEEEQENCLPILRPWDPTGRFGVPVPVGPSSLRDRGWPNLDKEIKLCLDVGADVESKTNEIITRVKGIMGVAEEPGERMI